MPDDFGTVLATRTLTWVDDTETERFCYVDFSVPVEIPAEGDNFEHWETKVRLSQTGEDTVRTCVGADYLQSLYHAMAMAGLLLSQLTIAPAIDWSELPCFGFPPPPISENGGGEGGCGCNPE